MKALAGFICLFIGVASSEAQEPAYTNSIGMEFVLIHPGTMQVGVFQPTCPDPNAPAGPPAGFGQGRGAGMPGQTGTNPTSSQSLSPNSTNSGRGAQLSPDGSPGPNASQQAGPSSSPGPGSAPGFAQANAQTGSQTPGANGAGGPGQGTAGGRGRGPARPQDPRAKWTDADYARCAELTKEDSSPGFTVNISKPYYMGKFEVTQGQWKKVMGNNPSAFQGDKVSDDADQHPVDSVSWQDAQAFVKKLNAMEKTKAYRLPTEFEWEYAGRAGGPGQIAWNDIRAQAWEQQGGQGNKASTHMIGTKQPNAWGLYDMLGNVWEWVQDYYNEKVFPDPVPPKNGTEHVLKGGGFLADVKNTIYAVHAAGPADGWDVGFRVVRDVK